MTIVIDIDDHKYAEIKEDAEKFRNKGMIVPYLYKIIESGTPLSKGHGRLIDANVVKQKVFDIIDLYDSGKYLVFDVFDCKYLIGDDIQNDNRRVLSFNEALQGVINGMSAIIEANEEVEK